MSTNTHTANSAIRFFRAFKISIPLALTCLVILYVGVFQAYKTFNPDVSNCKVTPIPNTQDNEIDFGNPFYRKAYYDHFRPWGPKLDTEYLKIRMKEALAAYKINKLKESALYSLIVLLGLPVVAVLADLIKQGRHWVEQNRTI